MGTHAIRSVDGFVKHRMDVGVRCLSCKREAVFEAKDVILYYRAKGLSLLLPLDTRPFVCRCGSRDLAIGPVPMAVRPSVLPVMLRPIYWRR